MNKKPLVSIIIPCYNYGRYLSQCLQSVAASNFDLQLIEILVINDASNDSTQEMVHDFSRNHSHIVVKFLSNEVNLGLARSRNRGIYHASGKYVFFLDADNYIGPECLRLHVKTLEENPDSVACYGSIQDFDSTSGKWLSLRSCEPFNYSRLLDGPYIDAMAMFRKTELISFGMYDTKMPFWGWEDYELWLRLGKASKKVSFIGESPLSFYRRHISNMGDTIDGDRFNQVLYFLKCKYPIRLEFQKTGILNHNPLYNTAQLFYAERLEEIDETNSVSVSTNHIPLEFRIPDNALIHELRFDPLNDYVHLQLKDVRFFKNGNERKLKYTLSSNAFKEKEGVYLFDTDDPQIYFNFKDNNLAGVDTVRIWVEYMSVGGVAQKIALELHKKRWDLVKKTTIFLNRLKKFIRILICYFWNFLTFKYISFKKTNL